MAIRANPSTTVRLVRTLFDGGSGLTGKTVAICIQRASDGNYWTGAAWQAGYSTAGNFTEHVGGAATETLYYFDFAIPSGDEIYLCSSKYDNSGQLLYWNELLIAQGVTLGTAGDVYHALVEFLRDDTAAKNYYTVTWLKNGVVQTAGVTLAKITLTDLSGPSTLINAQTLTDAGSHKFLYTATGGELLALGKPGLLAATATIDGSTRTWREAVARDGP